MPIKLDCFNLNLQDALDLAILIEEEAQERYEEFSRQVVSSYTGNAGTFFDFMEKMNSRVRRHLTLIYQEVLCHSVMPLNLLFPVR